jgi:hypothetical protein
MGYSPTLGRFLERDPQPWASTPNLYEYVDSRPLGFVDPTGLAGQLPEGVPPPTGSTIAGPILNKLNDIIIQEQTKLALEAARDPNREARLKALKDKQKGYSCIITVKSITYQGSDDVVSYYITSGPGQGGGPPSSVLTKTRYIRDKFQVVVSVKCNCDLPSDMTYTTYAVRGKEMTQLGPAQPSSKPPDTVTPIPGATDTVIDVPPGISGGTVDPGGFHNP